MIEPDDRAGLLTGTSARAFAVPTRGTSLLLVWRLHYTSLPPLGQPIRSRFGSKSAQISRIWT